MPPPSGTRKIFFAKEPPIEKLIDSSLIPILLPKPTFQKTVLRALDFLFLQFDFINLQKKIIEDKLVQLQRENVSKDAFIVVHFSPQSIAEEVFEKDEQTGILPIPTMISGPSRLVFKVPKGVTSINYTLKDLLDWVNYEQSVAPNALPSASLVGSPHIVSRPGIAKPALIHTAIEAPYHIILSPIDVSTGWAHSRRPVESGGRIEVWHTCFGVKKRNDDQQLYVDENNDEEERDIESGGEPGPVFVIQRIKKIMRAIYTPDRNPAPTIGDLLLFNTSLEPYHRYNIVELSSDFTLKYAASNTPYTPLPIDVEHLILSSLGAWIKVHGQWTNRPASHDEKTPLDVEDWIHRSTQGRDNYVRVVEEGYLFPLGHRASEIEITERMFERPLPRSIRPLTDIINTDPDTGPGFIRSKQRPNPSESENPPVGTYLRKRRYIVVREPRKAYPSRGRINEGRDWPFKSVQITTLVTSNLASPDKSDLVGKAGSMFWPEEIETKKPFPFHIIAVDLKGHRSEFTSPLIFLGAELAKTKPDALGDALDVAFGNKLGHDAVIEPAQNVKINKSRRNWTMYGQNILYAVNKEAMDTTSFETDTITYGWEILKTVPPGKQPAFYPNIARAKVLEKSLLQLIGRADLIEVTFAKDYLLNGFDHGDVFMQILNNIKLDFAARGADKVGGIATPNFTMSGISRSLGAVGGDINKVNQGKFNVKEYFKDTLNDAVILGGIKLVDILKEETSLNNSPTFTTQTSQNEVKTVFKWSTQEFSNNEVFKPSKNGACKLDLLTEITTKIPSNGETTTPSSDITNYHVSGTLSNFSLEFFGMLSISFDKFHFESRNGEKPDFSIGIAEKEGLTFLGALTFVNDIKDYIPSTGFSNGPNLDISSTGITAGYTLAIPTIGIGIFSLQNVSLSAELCLPFTGEPVAAKFAFSKREDPFLVSVAMFGGGGYFGIALNSNGLESVEAALEFGGNVSIDIGVASGGVYIMAGIYFHKGEDKIELSGYLRCGGALEILGLICISLEFYMSLNWREENSQSIVWGQAKLTVEIEIAFFSKTVELTVEREFAHSPQFNFADTVDFDDWNQYCEAFAPEVVA